MTTSPRGDNRSVRAARANLAANLSEFTINVGRERQSSDESLLKLIESSKRTEELKPTAKSEIDLTEVAKAATYRSNTLIDNPRTPAQYRAALRATDPRLVVALAQGLDRMQRELQRDALRSTFQQIREIGIDAANIVAKSGAQEVSGELSAAAEMHRSLSELCDPLLIYKELSLIKGTTDEVVEGAKILAAEIKSSEYFKDLIHRLEHSTAPLLPTRKDDHAVELCRCLLSSAAVGVYDIVGRTLKETLGLAADIQYVISGPAAMVKDNLEALFTNQLIGQLAQHHPILNATDRIAKVFSGIRFSVENLNSRGILSELDANVICQLKALHRLPPIITKSLLFVRAAEIWESLREYSRQISDTQLCSHGTFAAEALMISKPIWVTLKSQNIPGTTVTFVLNSTQCETQMIVCVDETHSQQLKYPQHPPFSFLITPNSQIIALSSGNMYPITELEMTGVFTNNPQLRDLPHHLARLVDHARYQLLQGMEQLPLIFTRLSEWPSNLIVELSDDLISVAISRERIEEVLSLYEYDEETYSELKNLLTPDPSEENSKYLYIGASLHSNDLSDPEKDGEEKDAPLFTSNEEGLRRELRSEVSRELRASVHNFGQLFCLLKEHFNVTLTTDGPGSHKMLYREGYGFSLAPKFRDPKEPLAYPIVFSLLGALNISLGEILVVLRKL